MLSLFSVASPLRRTFELDPTGHDYPRCAPFSFDNVLVTRASATQTFDAIVDIEAEREWFPDFASAAWITPDPQGVGSRRDYRLTYLQLTEHFLVWERGVRVMFEVTDASLPLVTAFAEDYQLVP